MGLMFHSVLATSPKTYVFLRDQAFRLYCCVMFGVPMVAFIVLCATNDSIIRSTKWCRVSPQDRIANIFFSYIWFSLCMLSVIVCPGITAHRIRRRVRKTFELEADAAGVRATSVGVTIRFVLFMLTIILNWGFGIVIAQTGVMLLHEHKAIIWTLIYVFFTSSMVFWPALTLTWSRSMLRLYVVTIKEKWGRLRARWGQRKGRKPIDITLAAITKSSQKERNSGEDFNMSKDALSIPIHSRAR